MLLKLPEADDLTAQSPAARRAETKLRTWTPAGVRICPPQGGDNAVVVIW